MMMRRAGRVLAQYSFRQQQLQVRNFSSVRMVQNLASEPASINNQEGKYMRPFSVVANSEQGAKTVVTSDTDPQLFCIMDESMKSGGKAEGMTPLQNVLGSLAGCEVATARFIAGQMGIQIGAMRFPKIVGWLDVRGFGKGDTSVPLHFQRVDMVCEIETDASEETINILKERVEAQCPVYGLFKAANCRMNIDWQIVKIPK